MKIKIIEISGKDSPLLFETSFGIAKGFWMGKTLPVVNGAYHVELDITEPLILGVNVFPADPGKSALIENKSGSTLIRGTIERVDSDGIAFLRIGESLIILGKIDGGMLPVGAFVEILASQLYIFDTNT